MLEVEANQTLFGQIVQRGAGYPNLLGSSRNTEHPVEFMCDVIGDIGGHVLQEFKFTVWVPSHIAALQEGMARFCGVQSALFGQSAMRMKPTLWIFDAEYLSAFGNRVGLKDELPSNAWGSQQEYRNENYK